MKIIRLSSENIKRLVAVDIKPDGNFVTIGGRNAQGKSSVLDSIAYALGGEKLIRGKPVRKGQDKAKVVVTLDDLVVTRTFTSAGTSALTVANKDGARYPSPQAILDKLVGRLTFDPLEFVRMKPELQADTLRRLAGLDVSDLERERLALYNQRTEVNRQEKALDIKAKDLPSYSLIPDEEASLSTITTDLDAANAAAAAVTQLQAELDRERQTSTAVGRRLQRLVDKIANLELQLELARSERDREVKANQETNARIDALTETLVAAAAGAPDLLGIRKRLEELEATNAKVRANKRRAEALQAVVETKKQSEDLTAKIDEIDRQKAERIRAAKFPIAGLSVADAGILFNDIPFEQASRAEQLRVSTAVGLALNPSLRVLLIRDGSALDQANLSLIADMAQQADAQVWLERVSDDGRGCSVVIEDGAVAVRPQAVDFDPVKER